MDLRGDDAEAYGERKELKTTGADPTGGTARAASGGQGRHSSELAYKLHTICPSNILIGVAPTADDLEIAKLLGDDLPHLQPLTNFEEYKRSLLEARKHGELVSEARTVQIVVEGVHDFDMLHIRNIMLRDTATMAIEWVEIETNTSDLDTPTIESIVQNITVHGDAERFRYPVAASRPPAQAMGVPITATAISALPPEPSSQTGARAKMPDTAAAKRPLFATLRLDVSHPVDAKEPRNVTSGDLIGECTLPPETGVGDLMFGLGGGPGQNGSSKPKDPRDPLTWDVRPANKDTLIVRLDPGQQVRLTALCVRGAGHVHAKHMPIVQLGWRRFPSIRIDPVLRGEDARRLVASCKQRVFSIGTVGDVEDAAIVSCAQDCNYCGECQKRPTLGSKIAEAVHIHRMTDKFLLLVESQNDTPGIDHFLSAVHQWKQNCDLLAQQRQQLLSSVRQWKQHRDLQQQQQQQ